MFLATLAWVVSASGGALFQRRFQAILVEKEGYLLELARDIVLTLCGRR